MIARQSASGQAKQALGRYGEDLAVRFLIGEGLTVIDRNWRSPTGELDIIGLDARQSDLSPGGDTVLVICEVKTRLSLQFGGPLVAVTPAKLARLRRLAGEWLDAHPISVDGLRIDVVGVTCPPRGRAKIEHLMAVG